MYIYGRKQLKDRECVKTSLIRGFGGIMTMGIAFGIRQLESKLCSPNSIFQLHAVWHTMLSIGLWLLFTCGYCQEFKQKYHFIFRNQRSNANSDNVSQIRAIEMPIVNESS